MGRRTIVIETRGDICMSDRDNPRSLVEIMNDVLSTVREHYDSEYVYYIEKEYEDIDVIYEWCAKHVPWQRDKIKMLPKDQRPRWMEQEITDTTEASYSVFRRLEENTVAILAAVGVHRGGCEVDLLRSVLAYLPDAITLQKLQKQQEYLSYHDKLTGLYNRNSFVSYTTDIKPDELNSLGAVSVDINGLKNFNKEFGRDYGDEVVIRVGEVLAEGPQRRRAQGGIHQGMGHHVCIGVPQQPQVVGNLHPAQNQFPAGHQPVYVIAMSDSHRPILSAKMAWPQVRSRGVVIFKLSSLPRVR